MKNTLLNLFFISFIACSTMAQNKLKDNEPFQKKIVFNSNISKQEAVNQYLIRQGLDANNTFVAKKESVDETKMEHQRNQQFYKGIKVEFGTLITHTRNGNVVSINSELYDASSVNLSPSLNSEECFNRAISNINAVKYLWEDNQQSLIVGYEKPRGELVIFPIVKTGEIKLAYKYDIYAVEPISRQEVYVDAHTGTILYKNPIIKHATSDYASRNNLQTLETLITGSANTKYSGVRSIETRFDTALNMYVLNDLTRGSEIITYNCERIPATYQDVHFKDNDNNWTTAEHANSFFDNAAQDAHWGAEMTYDFWKNIFNRNGFDNNNGLIKSYVHYRRTTVSLNNAFWNGSFMTYGDGASKPYTSIDICGHEIGHAVCTYTADLAYQNQSGAMNEAFSDIWGACIEHYGRTGALTGVPTTAVWRIGEDITNSGLRYMAAPTTLGDPDTFRGTNYIATGDDGPCSPTSTNDYCGVHSNSGVMNHWFYILTAGKSGTNNAPIAERDTYNVTGIGMVKSSQIAYYAERDYLTPNSTFLDARDATITIANSLYCASSPEVIAVTNSWFAVNIGPSFVSYTNDVAIQKIPITSSLSCGTSSSYTQTINFTNYGTNPITSVNIAYNVDGGTNVNNNWSGNISTCSTGSFPLTINTAGLTKGTHILNVSISITGDLNSSNNTTTGVIFVNTPTTINTINTFESANDVLVSYDLTGTNNVWKRGLSSKPTLTNTVASSSNVYATNLTGSYPSNTKSYLVSQCYDLSQTASPVLKFDMAYDMVYATDILYMQYSSDGGNLWNLLGTNNDPNWYTENTQCPNCVGSEWTGEADITNSSGFTNGTRRQYSYNLSSFGSSSSTPISNMMFRFVFQSDGIDELDGAIIDNFVVENTLSLNQSVFNGLNIYPNPVKDQLSVSFNSNSNDAINVSIYDMQGRLINKNSFESIVGTFNKLIDLSQVPTGLYLIKLNQGTSEYNAKILKK